MYFQEERKNYVEVHIQLPNNVDHTLTTWRKHFLMNMSVYKGKTVLKENNDQILPIYKETPTIFTEERTNKW